MRRHRRSREGPDSSGHPAGGCHFFKIILEANVRYQRLRIPLKFLTKFRDELADVAVLQVPTGKIWHVGLRRSNRKVWFGNGWQEFMEYHSIRENHLLVFRYDGNSRFYVFIFDMTACEIEYPCDPLDCEENNPIGGCKIEEIEEQSFEKILNVPSRPSGRTAASRKIMSDEPEEQLFCKTRERSGLRLQQADNDKNLSATVNAKVSVSREQQLQAAAAFKSLNPYCMVKMHSSYVSDPFILNMPRSFARKFVTECRLEVTLLVPDGSSWHVRCCCSSPGSSTKITKGWKQFVEENNLEKGDICIFQLVKKIPVQLKVFIYREQQKEASDHKYGSRLQQADNDQNLSAAQGHMDPKVSVSREKRLLVAATFKSANPYCMVKMHSSYVSGLFILNVPLSLARKFATAPRMGLTLLVPDGRNWDVQCRCSSPGSSTKITLGWKQFVEENNLEQGDICIFELVKKSPIQLKVFIYCGQQKEEAR